MINITRDEAIQLFTALGSKMADKWGRKQMTEKIHKVDEMVDTETTIPPEVEPILNKVLTAIEDGDEIVVTKERIEPESTDEKTAPEKTYSVYIHPESDSVFVDEDDQGHDGLSFPKVWGLTKEEAEKQKISIEKEYFDKIKQKEAIPEKTYSVYLNPESGAVFVALDDSVNDGLTQCMGSGLSMDDAEARRVIVAKEYCEKNALAIKKKQDKKPDPPELNNAKTDEASLIDTEEELDPPNNIKLTKPDGVRVVKSRSYYAGIVIRKHGISAGITEEMVNELDKMYKKRNRQESMYRLRLAWHAIYGFCGLDAK